MLELKGKTTQQRGKSKKEFIELLFWVGVCAFFIALFATAVLFQSAAYSAVSPPFIITYQGKLIENGESVTTTQSIKFLIYDHSTNASNILYSASGTTAAPLGLSITPSSGIFSINLGATSTNNALSPDIFKNNDPLYLEVVVDTTTLTPRKRITSVPFAINSEYLSGISATSTASSSTYIPVSASDGSFTFNTTTINTDFTVDSGVFYVDSINNRVGINTSTPNANYLFTVSGTSYLAGSTTITDLLTVSGKVGQPRHVMSLSSTTASTLDGLVDVHVVWPYAYAVANGAHAFNIIDVSDSSTTTVVGTLTNGSGGAELSQLRSVIVDNNYAYVTGNEGLEIIDVSNPQSPTHAGKLLGGQGGALLSGAGQFVISGQYAYIPGLTSDSLEVVDISNPTNPTHVFATSSALLDQAKSVEKVDDYLYLLTTNSAGTGLFVFDISNPKNPVLVSNVGSGGSLTWGFGAGGLVKNGRYLYAGNGGQSKLEIFDVVNPSNPVHVKSVLNTHTTFSSLSSMSVSANYLYISASASDKFSIFDVTSSTDPIFQGSLAHGQDEAELDGASGFFLLGNKAYVAASGGASDALEIIDISGATISNAEIGSARISNLSVDSFANFDQNINIRGGLNVGGNSLFGGDLSLSAPSSTLTSTNTLAFSHRALFSASSTLGNVFTFASRNSIADNQNLFRIQNTSSTDRFVLTGAGYLGIGGTSTPAFTLSVSGTAYITATTTLSSTTINGNLNVNSGIFYVDSINNRVGINTSTPNANYLLTVSGTSYFAGTTTISDLLNVEGKIRNPILVDQDTTPGNPQSLFVQGDYTYIADDTDGLRIFDTSNKKSLSQISVVNTSGNAVDVVVTNNYAFVADTAGGVDIIDVSNKVSPVLVNNLLGATPGISSAIELETQGNYLYVGGEDDAAFDALMIYDITAPSAVSLLGKVLLTGTANNISIAGNYAYIANGSGKLTIVDISDPTNPIVASEDIGYAGSALGVGVHGNYVYVGVGTDGLSVIDIGNLTALSEVGTYNTAGTASEIDVAGDYAYVSDGADGFDILDISDPTSPSLIKSFTTTAGTVNDVKVVGNYIYTAEALGVSGNFAIYDISGAKISNTEIGSAKISNLNVSNYSFFDQGLNIRGGISVGAGALINGDLTLSNASSTLNATNTIRFSNMALFQASSTNGYNFVFDTANTLAFNTSSYIVSVRNNGTKLFSISSNGDVITTGTYYGSHINVGTPGTPGDLAEYVDINPEETVEPGDVVCVDSSGQDRYRKCQNAYDQSVSGVISTNPTIITGFGKTKHTSVMALTGRVPIKVTLENGEIKRGDILIAASSTGYAMKYDPNKDDGKKIAGIIGIALDNFNNQTPSSTNRILGLVRTGWVNNQQQSISQAEQNISLLAKEIGINLNENPEELIVEENNEGEIKFVNRDLDLNNNYIINVAGIRGVNNKWEVDSNGRFVTKVETGSGEETLYAIQSQNTEFVFSGSNILVGGSGRVDFDEKIVALIDSSKPIKVSITLTQEANGIFVTGKDHTGFSVRELQGGNHDAMFDWVVIASRIISEQDQVEQDQVEDNAPIEEVIQDPPAEEEETEPPAEEEPEEVSDEEPEPQEKLETLEAPEEDQLVEEEIIPVEDTPIVEENNVPAPEEVIIEPVETPVVEEIVEAPVKEEPEPQENI